jgi:hypothetical protein
MHLAVFAVVECLKSFRFKKQENNWSGVRRHAAAFKARTRPRTPEVVLVRLLVRGKLCHVSV